MIVDNERDILLVLERFLSREGYKVLLADSGEKALQYIQAQRVDLVLLDMAMPKLNGVETLRKIRILKPDLRTMIITACPYNEKVAEAFRLGACECIYKPFNLNYLHEMIMTKISECPSS